MDENEASVLISRYPIDGHAREFVTQKHTGSHRQNPWYVKKSRANRHVQRHDHILIILAKVVRKTPSPPKSGYIRTFHT
jgi:hypothetical protein